MQKRPDPEGVAGLRKALLGIALGAAVFGVTACDEADEGATPPPPPQDNGGVPPATTPPPATE